MVFTSPGRSLVGSVPNSPPRRETFGYVAGDMTDHTESYFEETQRFPGWITVLVVLAAGSSIVAFTVGIYVQLIGGEPWGNNPMSDGALTIVGGAFIVFGFGLLWLFASLKLITEVHADALHIRFAPMRTKRIAFDRIEAAEVRTFRPIRDYGGWGVRYARGVKAYLAKGPRGVYLTMLDGRDILVGSQSPGELEAALRVWMR